MVERSKQFGQGDIRRSWAFLCGLNGFLFGLGCRGQPGAQRRGRRPVNAAAACAARRTCFGHAHHLPAQQGRQGPRYPRHAWGADLVPGPDRFAFYVFEGRRSHLLDFPNDSTDLNEGLLPRLEAMVGTNSLSVEPILSH